VGIEPADRPDGVAPDGHARADTACLALISDMLHREALCALIGRDIALRMVVRGGSDIAEAHRDALVLVKETPHLDNPIVGH
jgi:hypothetical protein